MNGPLKFLTARKILPLLDLLAKFKPSARLLVLPKCLCCLQAHKANFLFLLMLAKKSQCSAYSRMLAMTIRHPYYNGVAFSTELLEWGRTFSEFWL